MTKSIKITVTSDLHGYEPLLNGGDLLLIGGDLTTNDREKDWEKFFNWLTEQPYDKKIIIGGNHDNFLEGFPYAHDERTFPPDKNHLTLHQYAINALTEKYGFEYLCDSGTFYKGLHIWGSPWSNRFDGVHPRCAAFMLQTERELKKKFESIPEGVDIILTHSPPWGILDEVTDFYETRTYNTGSVALRQEIEKKRPRFHFFGHIHEHGGKKMALKCVGHDIMCHNVAYCTEGYERRGPIFEFEMQVKE